MSFLYEQKSARRWIPPWLRHQNMCRYEWAAEHVRSKRVLEVGCGSGDGARLLSSAGASSVLGLDVSSTAIANARRHPHGAALRFEVADGRALPAASGSFDLALALEAIEHVDDDRAFVTEIARVLTPSGVFLCSTPNRGVTNPGIRLSERPFNPHHVREYDLEEFRQVLAAGFARIEMIGQTFYSDIYRRVLAATGRRSPRLAVKLHQARKVVGIPLESRRRHWPRPIPRDRAPEVLIAVCSAPYR